MARVIPLVFLESATAHRDKVAFTHFDGTWKSVTYAEYRSRVKSLASYLAEIGVEKGDRVAIVAENRPEWCIAYFSISLAGGVAIPIDVQLGIDEIGNLLSDSEAKAVFCSEKTAEQVRRAAHMAGGGGTPGPWIIDVDAPDFGEKTAFPAAERYPEISEDDLASIIYTSGTTGKPKGVMLTHRNFCSDAEAVISAGIISPDDCVIGILPLHHTYPFMGNCLIPAFLGIPVAFPPSLKGPDIMETMRRNEVTILVSVPQLLESIRNGIFSRMGRLPGPLPVVVRRVIALCGFLRRTTSINLGRIVFGSVHKALGPRFRFAACGGAKLDPEIMEDLEALGLTVLEGYGLTETSPIVSFNPIGKRKPGSVGRPLPTAEIRIVRPGEGAECAFMEEGEIVIRGPMVMKGYYKNPEATEAVLKEGWFHSGDIGFIDREGYLFITGRLKEVIVLSSGKKVYPDEVEKAYRSIPFIKEMCVMGREEKGTVESLEALIVPDVERARRSGVSNIGEALRWEISAVSSRLPSYMRIRGFSLHPGPLPRTPLGKVRRFMVKELASSISRKEESTQDDPSLTGDLVGRRVVECARAVLKEPIPICSSDNLDLDLGLDSLAKIELIVALEKAFSTAFPETFFDEIRTVGELVDRIRAVVADRVSEVQAAPGWREILCRDPDREEREKVRLPDGFLDRAIVAFGLSVVKGVLRGFFRLSVRGLEHIPDEGPFIIAPNHVSYLDAFCVAAALPAEHFARLYSLGTKKYFTGKIGSWFARRAHVIPIDTERHLDTALQLSAFVLRNGKALLIFPEGGRSFDGDLMDFKKGIGILAVETGVPVVPTFIRGTHKALPRGSAVPTFAKVSVTFGEPLRPTALDLEKKPESKDMYQFFTDQVRERVAALGGGNVRENGERPPGRRGPRRRDRLLP